MNTQVTKTDPKTLMTAGDLLAMGDEDFRPEDLQAQQILLMQSTSDLVKEGTYVPSDILRGNEKVGDKNKRVEFIPLTYRKKWLISEHKNGNARGQFRGSLEQTAGLGDSSLPEKEKSGPNLPLEFKQDGVEFRRTKLLEVFMLLKQDLGSMVVPCVMWIRGGAYNRAGKAFMSHFAFSRANKVAPQHSYLSLGTSLRKNDLGSWFEYDLRPAGRVEEAHYGTIESWYELVRANKVQANIVEAEESNQDVTKESKF